MEVARERLMSTTHCPTHSCLAPSRQEATPPRRISPERSIPRASPRPTRVFPELPALEFEEELLHALGRQGGACEGAPFAEQGTDDARGVRAEGSSVWCANLGANFPRASCSFLTFGPRILHTSPLNPGGT